MTREEQELQQQMLDQQARMVMQGARIYVPKGKLDALVAELEERGVERDELTLQEEGSQVVVGWPV